mmetsp:Transcript_5987/g.19909  ORF Transcript_5987/g.19909 Transcript_5987/m.19909 type:complete len:204 (-) Transcript_5987:873-1484(-)
MDGDVPLPSKDEKSSEGSGTGDNAFQRGDPPLLKLWRVPDLKFPGVPTLAAPFPTFSKTLAFQSHPFSSSPTGGRAFSLETAKAKDFAFEFFNQASVPVVRVIGGIGVPLAASRSSRTTPRHPRSVFEVDASRAKRLTIFAFARSPERVNANSFHASSARRARRFCNTERISSPSRPTRRRASTTSDRHRLISFTRKVRDRRS